MLIKSYGTPGHFAYHLTWQYDRFLQIAHQLWKKNIFVLPFGNQHKKRQNFLLGKFLRINILSPTRITSKLARANLECQIRQRLGKKSAHNRQLMSSCSIREALEGQCQDLGDDD